MEFALIRQIRFRLRSSVVQKLAPPRQLLRHFLRAGGAGEIAFGHRAGQIEHAQCVAAKGFVHGLQVGERELVQRFALAFGQRHHRAHHVMGFAERHAFLHEVIREVGREQRGITRGGEAGEGVDKTFGRDALGVFDLTRALAKRNLPGAPGTKEVAKQLARWRKLLNHG